MSNSNSEDSNSQSRYMIENDQGDVQKHSYDKIEEKPESPKKS